MKADNETLGGTAMILAWIALFFTLFANFFCTYTVQNIDVQLNLPNNSSTIDVGPYYGGIWNYKTYQTVWSTDGEQVYVQTYARCSSIPDGIERDAKWKTAQAFTIIAVIVGALATFGMMSSTCGLLENTMVWKPYTGALLLACFSQGMSLIFLKSNACIDRSLSLASSPGNTTDITANLSTCKLGSGGIVGVVALCLWFLTALISGKVAVGGMGEDRGVSKEEVAEEVAEKVVEMEEQARAPEIESQ